MSFDDLVFDPMRFAYEQRRAPCTRDGCNHVGLELGLTDDPGYMIALYCPECGNLCHEVSWPPLPIPERERPYRFIEMAHSEPWLTDFITRRLRPHFEIYSQVRLKHRTGGLHRIDLVAIPRETLAETFPYRALGIEVKNKEGRVQGFSQALAYRQCRFNDDNSLLSFRAEDLDCVALYQGRQVSRRNADDGGETVRVVGRWNVGEIVHDDWHGEMLLRSGSRIWSSRVGVPVGQMNAPRKRRIANSRRRQ